MRNSIRLLAAVAAFAALTGVSAAHMDKDTANSAKNATPPVKAAVVTPPCTQKEVRDANGKIIIAGCAGIAMPCLSDSDCCSNNCSNSACFE
jgi:hypothetical protein